MRIAELEIDPLFVDQYRAALMEEIQTSIADQPGVLTLNAVSIKGDPTRIRIFETYADMDAYYSHIQSPHFRNQERNSAHDPESDTLGNGSRSCRLRELITDDSSNSAVAVRASITHRSSTAIMATHLSELAVEDRIARARSEQADTTSGRNALRVLEIPI